MGFAGLAVGAAMVCINNLKPEFEKPFISQFDTLIAFHHLEFKCSYIDVRNHLKIKFSLWEIIVGDWFKKKTSMLQ